MRTILKDYVDFITLLLPYYYYGACMWILRVLKISYCDCDTQIIILIKYNQFAK